MKIFEILLNITAIIFTVTGVLFFWLRISYMRNYEKKTGDNIFNILIGAIWFPLKIEADDDNHKRIQKRRINLLLRTLYILFLIIIIFLLVDLVFENIFNR